MNARPIHSLSSSLGALLSRLGLVALSLVVFVAVAANSPCRPGPEEPVDPGRERPALTVEIVSPRDGAVVPDGPNALVLARAVDADMIGGPASVVFELSADGETWVELPRQTVMDAGPGTWSTGLTTAGFEEPQLFVRARPTDDPTGERGDVVAVAVNRAPLLNVFLHADEELGWIVDARESFDPDGEIVLYRYVVAGEPLETRAPWFVLPRELAEPGLPFAVSVVDDRGSETRGDFVWPEDPVGGVPIAEDPTCGCRRMTVRFDPADRSHLADPSSGNRVNLGTHPDIVAGAFEIDAEIAGDPDLCAEGQQVRGTHTIDGTAYPKKACSAGRALAICDQNSDCDTIACSLPNFTEFIVETAADAWRCILRAGRFRSLGDGVCTEYPYTGAAHGNDDYRGPYPADLGPKEHRPNQVVWFDAPGVMLPRTDVHVTVRTQGHFIAEVSGPAGRCRCGFTYELEWDGANQVWTQVPTITLDAAGNENCALDDGTI